jgi:hypothetical protein
MKVFFFMVMATFSFASMSHGTKLHGAKMIVPEVLKLEPGTNELINQTYIKDIKSILMDKCFNCHSGTTHYPWYYKVPVVGRIMDSHIKEARSHLDFSKDYPFIGHAGQIKDLEAIIKVTKNGEMPPWYYSPFHDKSKLTEDEENKIIKWARASLDLLKQNK